MNRRHFLQSAAAAAAWASPVRPQTPRPEIRTLPIEFGSAKQVFADWYFVEAGYGLPFSYREQQRHRLRPRFMPHGVTLRLYPPLPPPAPALVPDTPTDGMLMGGYTTLLKDGGKYRLWYEAYGTLTSDEEAKICYAESDDGETWRKPRVGSVEHEGSRDHNIVFKGGHGGTVFVDSDAPPGERYKLIHLDAVPLQEVGGKQINSMVFGAVSPDGIGWRRLAKPILAHTSDTQSVAIRDLERGKYVAYVRGWEPRTRAGYGGRRVVMRTEADRFDAFGEPRLVLALGPDDPPDADIYTNAYQRWPGARNAHIMMPAIYHRSSDRVDLQIAVSRDGVRWERPQRSAWLPAGEPGSGFEGAVYAGVGLTPVGRGQWMFPMTRYATTHNENWPELLGGKRHGAILLPRLREDGLMALEAETQGECWTQPATFVGARLRLNCWGTLGSRVAVELADADGQPYPGFSLDECDGLEGDLLWRPVSWRGNVNVGALEGRLVRVRFVLRRARLYAFQFGA